MKIEDIEREVEEASTITEKTADTKRKLNNLLKKRVNAKPAAATEGQSSAPVANIIQVEIEQQQVETSMNNNGTSQIIQVPPVQGPTSQHLIKPRLPKLNLPKFKGDANSYTSFWDIFENAVHKNEGLAVIDKLNYLHSLLEGSAARAIEGLTLTTTNYDSAIQILKGHFGRPQHLIATHMEELAQSTRRNRCALSTIESTPISEVWSHIQPIWQLVDSNHNVQTAKRHAVAYRKKVFK